MEYIETPIKTLITRKGGKGQKMTKSTQTNEAPKASKRYQKTRGEHAKDILIAVLVTGVIAFVAGTVYANKQNAQVQNAVKAAQVAAPVASAEGK